MAEIFLRALEPGDVERIHRWHNSAELYRHLGGRFRHVGRPQVEEWLRQRTVAENEVNLAICRAVDSRHIGNVYLRNIDWVARNAEFHIFIGEPGERGKNFGSAATREMLRYAFDELALLRVYLYVLSDNKAAQRIYEKCGFRTEGILRAHGWKTGRPADVVVMGLLREEARL